MKLSEMSTEKLADALVRMVEPAREIVEDAEFIEKLKQMAADRTAKTQLENIAGMAFLVVPLLLERHRSATYTILSALTGKTVKQIAAQPGMQTLREARDSVDQELLDFFGLSGSSNAGM